LKKYWADIMEIDSALINEWSKDNWIEKKESFS